MSKTLEKDQARVVLEFRKTIYVSDLDLFSTFTMTTADYGDEKTLCVAGPTEGSCGHMIYGGKI